MTAEVDSLRRILAREAIQPVDAAAAALTDALLQRHGRAVAAVMFYGSCLRLSAAAAAADSVFDFYVLVDEYRAVYKSPLAALSNLVLPPNVFYLEVAWRGRRLRAKYAIVSLAQFRRLVSASAFLSYFWARFAQPVRLAHARDDGVRASVVEALADAVATLAARVAELMGGEFTPAELWMRAFVESYRAELRAERAERARLIYEADAGRYDRLAEPALRAAGFAPQTTAGGRFVLGVPAHARRTAGLKWALRRMLGKLLSVLRLAKGIFTFDGGLDYILWKIERHSGVKAIASPWQRRHPLLAAPGLAWRLYRQGAFR